MGCTPCRPNRGGNCSSSELKAMRCRHPTRHSPACGAWVARSSTQCVQRPTARSVVGVAAAVEDADDCHHSIRAQAASPGWTRASPSQNNDSFSGSCPSSAARRAATAPPTTAVPADIECLHRHGVGVWCVLNAAITGRGVWVWLHRGVRGDVRSLFCQITICQIIRSAVPHRDCEAVPG
jgi:hypothetical protein